jgi:hypothetical protein
MNYLIYIVIALLFIYLYYFNLTNNPIKEYFTDNSTIILLGDSVFKNNLYVSNPAVSIENQLKLENPSLLNEAQDGAVIIDVFDQMEKLPESYNKKTTHLYISAGGNDIIYYYLYKNIPKSNLDQLDTIFKKYTKLINSLLVKFDQSKVFLFDIYYPQSERYKPFYPIIKLWNQKIEDFTREKNIEFIPISREITEPTDLTHEIEPSSTGGLKIVQQIIDSMTDSSQY